MDDSGTSSSNPNTSPGTTVQRRRRGVVAWLAIGMVIAGTLAALVSMIRPLKAPFFVPIWVTQYDSWLLPIQTYSEQDRVAILDSDIFDRERSTELSNPTQIVLRGALEQLAQDSDHDAIVVYINGLTTVDERGLCLLPSDADPLDPSTFIPIRDILTTIAKCSSRHSLVVFDVQRSFSDPRIGIYHDGINERLLDELKAVPDEGRLVLLSASAGQWARVSHVLNRSLFGYYFEQGLLGAADGYNESGNRNARVSARELASYLAAHVDRWARLVDGMRQIPELIGPPEDFELSVALPPDQMPPDPYTKLFPPPKTKSDPSLVSIETAATSAVTNITDKAKSAISTATGSAPPASPAPAPAPGAASPAAPAAASTPDPKQPTAATSTASAAEGSKEPAANPASQAKGASVSPKAQATASSDGSGIDDIVYPDWLLDGWKLHDQWREEQAYRVAPRIYQQLVGTLSRATRLWQNADPSDHIAESFSARIMQLKRQYEQFRAFPRPRPFSLAAAELRGETVDPTVVAAVKDAINKWQNSQLPPAKPEEMAAARAKLIQEFAAFATNKSPFAVEYAIHQAAASDTTLSLEKLQFLNALRQSVYPEPHFLETRLIDRLASLNVSDIESSQAISKTQLHSSWRLLLAQAIQLDLRAEQAIRRPLDFTWLADQLEPAENLCWEAEIYLLSMGYVPFDLAQSKITMANAAFQSVQSMSETLDTSCNYLLRTTCDVSQNLASDQRGGSLNLKWDDTVDASLDIYRTLYESKEAANDPLASPVRNEQLRQNNIALQSCLDRLMAPFSKTNVSGLLQEAQETAAPARLRVTVDSILDTPFVDAESRKELSLAERRLERKRAKEVLELDSMEQKNHRIAPAPTLSVSDRDNSPAEEQKQSLMDAHRAVMLLHMVGYDPLEIERFTKLIGEAPTNPASFDQLKFALREVWSKGLTDRLIAAKDVATQARLSLACHPFEPISMLDDIHTNPIRRIMIADHQKLWTWIANELDFHCRDAYSSNLIASAAREYGQFASVPPAAHPIVTHEFDPPSPSTPTGTVSGRISIQIFGLPDKEPTIGVPVALTANSIWFNVTLGTPELDPTLTSAADGSQRYLIPFQITLLPGAFSSGIPFPKGFLAQIPIGRRQYHHPVTLPDPNPFAADGLEIWMGTAAVAPQKPAGELRLRPLGTAQEYFLFLLNRTTLPEKLQITVKLGDDGPPAVNATVEVAAGASAPIPFPKQPLPKEELAKLTTPLVIEISRVDQPKQVIRRFAVPVSVISPSEYVRVAYTRFEPPAPPDLRRNRLSVVVEQTEGVDGPPIEISLSFPPELLPGYQGELAGLLRTTLTPKEGRRTLQAEGIEFDANASRSGSFALNVDGVERAFLFDATFPLYGTPSSPILVSEPRIRIDAPTFTQPTSKFAVRVPMDGAPADGRLSVVMGAKQANEIGRIITVDEPRERRVGYQLSSPNGGILLSATIRDNVFLFDTNGMSGPQRLEASFRQQPSTAPVAAETTVYVDARPPIVEFFDVPKKIAANQMLPVELVVKDLDVPIEQVRLFFGAFAKDGSIPPTSELFPAEISDPRVGLWEVTLPLPQGTKKGPIVLSAIASNRAGLNANKSMTVMVSDAPPAGKIEGTVSVGGLRQPACDVYLVTLKGKVAQKTKTDANGVFRFDTVTPGKFKVSSASQSSSQIRSAASEVTVDMNKTITVNLELKL